MTDSPDELILKMQHLEAQAKESLRARAERAGLDRLKSSAQKLAWESQQEVAAAEAIELAAEQKLDRAKQPGLPTLEAAELLRAGRTEQDEARRRLVKARAKLNYALDQMTEVDRREYEAFHAEVRADTHGHLAEDPLFEK